nr:hypothetical protein [Tanacetum cinerariifolium]
MHANSPSKWLTLKPLIKMVIEFGDSYKAPPEETGKCPASESSTKKKGRTVAITTKDMQKRRNDVKARTTLLLALPDEYQLRFSKLQAIVSHLEFMDVEIEQDDLNQKFLTSLAPEWLMYTIVWRNIYDLDIMSLDDVYNHFKVYEPEVQKKSESNSQNIAFISSSNTSSGKGEVHTASVPTASIQVSTASNDVAAASLSHDTVSGFDKSKVECFNCHKMSHFAREFRVPRSQNIVKRERYKQGPKEEELAPKALMAIDGLPEFVDDTVTDYRRPTPSIDASKCNKSELQSSNFSVNARKSTVKYAEMYRNISKDNEESWPKDNYNHKSMTSRAVLLKPGTTPIVVSRPNKNVAQPKMTSFAKTAHSNVKRYFQGKSVVKNQPRVPTVSTVTAKFPLMTQNFPLLSQLLLLIWEMISLLINPGKASPGHSSDRGCT